VLIRLRSVNKWHVCSHMRGKGVAGGLAPPEF